jgi:hypothetical protein
MNHQTVDQTPRVLFLGRIHTMIGSRPPAWAEWATTTPASDTAVPVTENLVQDSPLRTPEPVPQSPPPVSGDKERSVPVTVEEQLRNSHDLPSLGHMVPHLRVAPDLQVPVHTLSPLLLSNMVLAPHSAEQLLNTYAVTMWQVEPQETEDDCVMMTMDKNFMMTGSSMLAGVRRHLQQMADEESQLRGVTCFAGYPVNARWANLQLRSKHSPGTLPNLVPVEELHVPTGVCSMEEWPTDDSHLPTDQLHVPSESDGKTASTSRVTVTHLYLKDKAGEPRSRTSETRKICLKGTQSAVPGKVGFKVQKPISPWL